MKESIKENIEIIYQSGDQPGKDLKQTAEDNIKELEEFYNTELKKLTIQLPYSREELNKKLERETPDWLIAVSTNKEIYMLSPSIIKQCSSHEEITPTKTLTHELVHIFNAQLNHNAIIWLNEGTALLLAGQKTDKDFSKEDWTYFLNNFLTAYKLSDFDAFANHDGYGISKQLVKKILEQFGKEALIKLIKIDAKQEDFIKEASKIIGLNIKKYIAR